MATTVLVVDDHPSFRRFARKLLEASGFVVVGEADDAASALEAVRALRPEVVLLDVLLPDRTGLEVAETLAFEPQRPTVVLTSSHSADDLGIRLDATPVRGFVGKRDLTPTALFELIDVR